MLCCNSGTASLFMYCFFMLIYINHLAECIEKHVLKLYILY